MFDMFKCVINKQYVTMSSYSLSLSKSDDQALAEFGQKANKKHE